MAHDLYPLAEGWKVMIHDILSFPEVFLVVQQGQKPLAEANFVLKPDERALFPRLLGRHR